MSVYSRPIDSLSRLALFSCVFLLFGSPAYAYIDPGTGGVVFSALTAIYTAGAVALAILIGQFRKLMRRIKGRSNRSNDTESISQ